MCLPYPCQICEWDSCCPALFEMFQDNVEQAHLNGTQLLFLFFCFLYFTCPDLSFMKVLHYEQIFFHAK